jgi:hypothetical protein
VDEEAGARAGAQRRLLGPKPAFKNVRIACPEQATQVAELVSGSVDIIKAVLPTRWTDQQVGPTR